MDDTLKMVCPVCGESRRSTDPPSCICSKCGFRSAFVNLFLDENSRSFWQDLAKVYKETLLKERRASVACSGCFSLGGSAMSLYIKNDDIMYIFQYDGTLRQEEKAVRFSSSERNYSVLYSDGSVRVFGNDDANYGLLRTENWSGIKAVLSAPNCTYGVTGDGKVVSAGSAQYPEVKNWDSIVELAGGTGFILGLKNDGKAVAAGDLPDPSNQRTIEQWTKVTSIAASRNGVLALHDDGKVSFAGKGSDTRNDAEKWDHVSAIAIDNNYALGLTEEGKILLAGKCRPFLDKGRSAAAGWERIIAVSCTQTGIGAINEDGELLVAGLIPGDLNGIQEIWNRNVKSKIKLI